MNEHALLLLLLCCCCCLCADAALSSALSHSLSLSCCVLVCACVYVQVKEVIWKHRLLVYGSFDYYATLYSTALDECNESDVHSLSFNGYLAMVRDAKFISKFCPARLLEIIFKAVNVDDDNVREKLGQNALARDEFNKMHRLNRHEFVEALVRVSVVRYVQSKRVPDVSDAVDKCCQVK